ncbi:MAG: cytochrome c biogenesis protein ResB [Propionibacteriaceae bacterium]|jgi:cytochrome c biogenesis protein|nr:cytochrome c biogenesis protein ResB [Propionibacteriaceae bacterium]
MSEEVNGGKEKKAGDVATEDQVEVNFGEFFRRVYQVTYSKTIGLIIIITFAVFALLGAVFQQAPEGTYGDVDAKAQFLAAMQSKYGGWTSVLDFLGIFHVFTSIGFLVVCGALAISLIGCTTHRIPPLVERFRSPRVMVSERFYGAARYQGSVATELKPKKALIMAHDELKKARYRVIAGDETSLYADKWAWGGIGTVVAHLAFLMILCAFVVSGLTSYSSILPVWEGREAVAIVEGSSIKVEVTEIGAVFVDQRPEDYFSNLKLFDGDTLVAEQTIRVNTPLNYKGWGLHQADYGPAVDVRLVNPSDEGFVGTILLRTKTSVGLTVGGIYLPERGVYVEVSRVTPGVQRNDLAPEEALFQVYSIASDGSDQLIGMKILYPGETYEIGDLFITYDRESQYTGILVTRDPGAIWMWIGSGLLVIGMTITFTCRHRRVWVRAIKGELQFASADKEDSGFRRLFEELVAQAETWSPERSK